jgi:hypothetical protein
MKYNAYVITRKHPYVNYGQTVTLDENLVTYKGYPKPVTVLPDGEKKTAIMMTNDLWPCERRYDYEALNKAVHANGAAIWQQKDKDVNTLQDLSS